MVRWYYAVSDLSDSLQASRLALLRKAVRLASLLALLPNNLLDFPLGVAVAVAGRRVLLASRLVPEAACVRLSLVCDLISVFIHCSNKWFRILIRQWRRYLRS